MDMDRITRSMRSLNEKIVEKSDYMPISFESFLRKLVDNPSYVLRNVFQAFHDMVVSYVGEGIDEYPDDPESINFVKYDCNRLFVEEVDHPFFADRLFANRFVNLVQALKRGAQQNMVYIFRGPPGCGKSTFLNNLLLKIEEYSNTEEGLRYEIVWRFNRSTISKMPDNEAFTIFEKLYKLIESKSDKPGPEIPGQRNDMPEAFNENIDIPCPSHDHPILIIPKKYRRAFLENLFEDSEFKEKLFSEMEYDWVFKENPCTICTSLYQALLEKYGTLEKVFEIIYARPYRFNRQLGEGVSVYNPGDEPVSQKVHKDEFIQSRLNSILNQSNKVRYIYSQYAKTNNGVYGLMDIKSHNTQRLIELHNIISEGLHKVEDIEENVYSLLVAVMNPEDQKNIQNFKSFSDRISYINIPYVMDLNTEVEIYRNIFGKNLDSKFLPRVLRNFARVIISTRISSESKALLEWVQNPEKYKLYCDKNLNLLKMEIYAGYIPEWIMEEDRKRFNAKMRRKIIGESDTEGEHGISGRDSIRYFNDFYSTYAKENKLINMADLFKFFTSPHEEINKLISNEFLDSLLHLYNYTVLQEVKESLYYYNKEQISKDILNYLFAINFEIGSTEKCLYTGDKLDITEEFLEGIEERILGKKMEMEQSKDFRERTQKEYTTSVLSNQTNEILQTKVYGSLYDRYIYNIKEKALDPFLKNENFRRAIKDIGKKDFKTYDKRIQTDVQYLIKNLCIKFAYSEQGAREVCIYVIDNDLAKKYATAV